LNNINESMLFNDGLDCSEIRVGFIAAVKIYQKSHG